MPFSHRLEPKKSGNHEIDFFHVPYGILGGDWLAERELPDGRQVVVVADVTGKGIPAAMVVQCVQSLWAASLAEPQFDADKWLQSLNQALCTLGRTQGTHSVSMGVMVLAGSHCTYFSAGHVPMYFARDIHDHRSIVPINARGSVLGLDPLVTFQPEIIALPVGEPYILMLGTDGILDWQTRRSGRAVQRIIRGALDEGMSAIAKHPVSDDKIMIIIRAA
ncbi:MAG: serine/threonine-protein phosphatase [Deltaproteobacteria bacterium]|nr:serine/threonine-protein phosphatase [Deltaproteobacteria bacterium]